MPRDTHTKWYIQTIRRAKKRRTSSGKIIKSRAKLPHDWILYVLRDYLTYVDEKTAGTFHYFIPSRFSAHLILVFPGVPADYIKTFLKPTFDASGLSSRTTTHYQPWARGRLKLRLPELIDFLSRHLYSFSPGKSQPGPELISFLTAGGY